MSEYPSPGDTRRERVAAFPAKLADGREWWFSCPTVRLIPKVVTGVDRTGKVIERVSVEAVHGYPAAIQNLIDTVRLVCDGGSTQEQYGAFFALAARLLTTAHDISLEHACELLSVTEHELPRLAREILSIALGDERTTEGKPGERES
jgi:hypothetical protein